MFLIDVKVVKPLVDHAARVIQKVPVQKAVRHQCPTCLLIEAGRTPCPLVPRKAPRFPRLDSAPPRAYGRGREALEVGDARLVEGRDPQGLQAVHTCRNGSGGSQALRRGSGDVVLRRCGELAPDLFIEAGAKDACASRRFREGLPDARVVAFEANPFTFKRFKKKIDYPAEGVEYVHRA